MPQSMQGIIIALLISFLIGIIIGFYLRQGWVNQLTNALKDSEARNEALQLEHEERLRGATAQLQQDYEGQLAEQIERYQSQYEEQLQQLEAEYQARQGLISQGAAAPEFDPANPEGLVAGAVGSVVASEAEQRIRKQYEARLKEAAYKIQQAYEQHLRDKLAETRQTYQSEYDQRLAQAIEHYQDESEARLAEALRDRELQATALSPEPTTAGLVVSPEFAPAAETQIQERLAALEVDLRREYDRRLADRIEQYQDEMTQRTAQLEQEFSARLQMAQATQPAQIPPSASTVAGPSAAEIEARLQADYDQRLADMARHQDELVNRTQALEAELAARQMASAVQPIGDQPSNGGDAEREAHLRWEIETSLRAEYEQRLAEKIEQYQDELNQRTRELEEGLEARLQFLQPAVDGAADSPEPPLSLEDRGALDLDLDDLLTAPTDAVDLALVDEDHLAAEIVDAALAAVDSPPIAPETTPENEPQVVAAEELELDGLIGWAEEIDAPADSATDDMVFNFDSAVDESGLDLDNLDALLNDPDAQEESTEDIFNSLDDLSNLS
jgi:hypothetical protein